MGLQINRLRIGKDDATKTELNKFVTGGKNPTNLLILIVEVMPPVMDRDRPDTILVCPFTCSTELMIIDLTLESRMKFRPRKYTSRFRRGTSESSVQIGPTIFMFGSHFKILCSYSFDDLYHSFLL